MLTGRHEGSRHVTAVVRDVVEIVAIVAAGIWAIYTFIYIERLKPAWEGPNILVTGSLQRLGERDGYVALEYSATVKNIGHNQVYIVATGFSANGIRFATGGNREPVESSDHSTIEFSRDDRLASVRTVYRMIQYTRYANKAFNNSYEIDPGDEIPYSGMFLVKRSEYDEVTFDAGVAFSKYPNEYPVKANTSHGTIYFQPAAQTPDLMSLEVLLARTSLW